MTGVLNKQSCLTQKKVLFTLEIYMRGSRGVRWVLTPPPPGKFNFLKFKFLNSQIQNSHSKMTENMPRTPPPENLNIQISLGPPPPPTTPTPPGKIWIRA